MSFEGYYQYLCKNGHYHTCDVYDTDSPFRGEDTDKITWCCDLCGEPLAWWDLVYQTNDAGHPTKLKLKTPAIQGYKCDACNHSVKTGPATYYIPKEGGHLIG